MNTVVGFSGQQVSSLRDLNGESQHPWVPVEWVEARSVLSRLTDGSSVENFVSTIGASEVALLRSCLNVGDVRLLDLPSVTRLERIVAGLRESFHCRLSEEERERLQLLQVWLIARRVRLAKFSLSVLKAQMEWVTHLVIPDA